jgi:hypothetical protein
VKTGGLSLDQAPAEDIPLRFFISAPIFGILAGLMVLLKGNLLFSNTWMPETVALTHLLTLGWMGSVMFGALYQMIPVLVGGIVPFPRLSRMLHTILIPTILLMVSGFFWNHSWMLKASLALLFPTILLFLLQLVQPLVQADGSRPVVLAMRFAAICLSLTLLLGSLNLLQYSGWWSGFLDRNLLKTLHLQMGLLGWIGFLIFGVGFHVIPMFYLSKPFSDKQARGILVIAFGSLSALSTGSILGMGKDWLLLFSLPGLASVFYFSYTLLRMLHQRKRKIHDSTLRLWQGGILALCLSLPLGLSHLVSPSQQWLFLFGIFFIGGFAISVSIGMLYKIVPFLIWFHRFSSLVGQVRVPLLKDLLPKRGPSIQATLHGVSLLLICSGIFFHEDLSIRIGAGLWMISSLMLLIHLIFVVSHKPKISTPPFG